VRSSPERVVRVRALAGNIVLCSWARHLTLTVPLSTQVYKWVPVNCWGKPNNLRGSDLRWTSILSRGSRNTPSRFMLQKPGISSGSYGPLGSKGFKVNVVTLSYLFRIGLHHLHSLDHIRLDSERSRSLAATQKVCKSQTHIEHTYWARAGNSNL